MAASGVLAPGHKLPGIRQLAADLGLAPGTVARAYRELEASGTVVTHPGRGTSIRADKTQMSTRERQARLVSAAREYVAVIRTLGVDQGQAIAALRDLL